MIKPAALKLMREAATSFDGISQELFEISNQFEMNPRFSANSKLYSLVRSAEQATLHLRSVTRATQKELFNMTYEDTPTAICVSIKDTPVWIEITVPAILPGRNRRDNTLFITRPLRNALIRYQKEKGLPRFQDCVICIVHQYDESLGIRRIRDYDNIETKRYIDVIESLLMTSDSGLYCSIFQTSEMADRDCTKFYLMKPDTLPEWLEKRGKTMPNAF